MILSLCSLLGGSLIENAFPSISFLLNILNCLLPHCLFLLDILSSRLSLFLFLLDILRAFLFVLISNCIFPMLNFTTLFLFFDYFCSFKCKVLIINFFQETSGRTQEPITSSGKERRLKDDS